MARLWEKILLYLGLAEEELDYQEEHSEQDATLNSHASNQRKGKILSLHTTKNQRVVISKPENFGEVKNIADNLKNRRGVILNLENTGLEDAKRILDFVSGTAYTLDCNVQKVSENIFIFTPDNIDLTAEVNKNLTEKGILHPEKAITFKED